MEKQSIAERLRIAATDADLRKGAIHDWLIEAAEEINKLTAERDRLKYHQSQEEYKLRTALGRILDLRDAFPRGGSNADMVAHCRDVALNALDSVMETTDG